MSWVSRLFAAVRGPRTRTRHSGGLRTFLREREQSAARATPTGRASVESDEQVIVHYLHIVRETTTAASATLWRLGSDPESRATAWFTTGDGEEAGRTAAAPLEALIRWAAAEAGAVHFDGASPPRVAATALRDPYRRGSGGAVLSVNADSGLAMDREALRGVLASHAEHVGSLLSLLDTRRVVRRQASSTTALLRAAQEFQASRSLDRLAVSICSAAVELSGAERAALVRWRAATHEGEIEGVSGGHWASAGVPVQNGSLVAQACRDAMPMLWADAALLGAHAAVYGGGEARPPLGTLAIVPLERDLGVVGAIVVESDAPGEVTPDELKSMRLLAAVAAVSLEAQWEFDEVAHRARTDQLTGLPNRRFFDEQLARMLAEAERFEHSVSLVLLDVDHFKKVNDTFGHDAGDAVLTAVAGAVRERVRGVDVCARYGGEEIAVLLPNTDGEGAAGLAERLRSAVEGCRVRLGGRELQVTASLGVATYPRPVARAGELFAAADRELYVAKGSGRNCISVAS